MSEIFSPAELDRLCETIAERVAAKLSAKPELLDRQGLCQTLGFGVTTLDRLVREGRVPSVQAGRRRLFDPDAVKKALENKQ